MAVNCPSCGRENVDGARFCLACGAAITPPSAATVIQPPPAPTPPPAPDPSTAPTTGMPAVAPGPAPAYTPPPPAYTPPPPAAPAYTPPAQAYVPPAQPQPYAPAAPSYQQPAYQQPAYAMTAAAGSGSRRSGASIAGALIVMLCGILILVSSFMAWYGVGGFFSESGWDLMKDMQDSDKNPFVNTTEVELGESKLIFSGLCSLIIGGIIILFGLLALLVRSKGLGVLLLLLSIGALVVAGINTYSFLTIEGFNLEAGMYMFLFGSVGGTIGSIVCTAG